MAAEAAPLLSAAQVESFKLEGCLELRGLVPPEVLESWREQFWRTIEASPGDSATWPGKLEDSVLSVRAQAS